MRRLKGFTLAEVLLALSIIAVIATLTVPALSKNYQKHIYAINAKKNLTAIENLLTNVQVDSFADTFNKTRLSLRGGVNSITTIRNTIKTYLDVNTTASNTTSFAPSYRSIDSNSSSDFECSGGTILVLESGASFCYMPETDKAFVIIDYNGNRPPNTGGKDIFTYTINNDFSVTDDGDCTTSEFGQGCLKSLMDNDWKMEY